MYRARYRRIVLFFARVILGIIFWDVFLPRLGLRRLAQRTRPSRLRQSAIAFRALAIEMGGVLIKVGQFLSARVDVLPAEFTTELAGLQDEVPPASFNEIRPVAEGEFGMSLGEKFAEFETTPLAAASLGQVHRARLKLNGKAPFGPGDPLQAETPGKPTEILYVVVKIQRPNIEGIIATDLAALRTVGEWLRRYRPISRRADVPSLLDEFTHILYEEIDYLAEGRNAETFAVNFSDQPEIRVPKVIWTHTTKRVLTLENVWAIKITDYESITAAGIDRSEVASRLLNTYLQQIFEDGFFHADPHPGNLFVSPLPPDKGKDLAEEPLLAQSNGWQLTFVDFGMVGRVPNNLREGLREMVIGVGLQDASRVVQSYQTLGLLLPNADLELLERAEAKAFDRFWGKTMTELADVDPKEIREFTHEFRELIYRFPFQIPHNIILLARTVGILSGMCTGLDPEFNLWDHLAPFARKLIAEEARANRASWLAELETLGRTFLTIPVKLDTILTKMESGEVAVRAPEVSRQVTRLEYAIRQVAGAIIFAALLLGGVQLYLGGRGPFGEILLAGAGMSLIWAIVTAGRGK